MSTCQHDWHLPMTRFNEWGSCQIWHITAGWGFAVAMGTPNAETPLHSHGYYRCRKCETWANPCSIGYHKISHDPEEKLGYNGKFCWSCTPSCYLSNLGERKESLLAEAKQVFDPDYVPFAIGY